MVDALTVRLGVLVGGLVLLASIAAHAFGTLRIGGAGGMPVAAGPALETEPTGALTSEPTGALTLWH